MMKLNAVQAAPMQQSDGGVSWLRVRDAVPPSVSHRRHVRAERREPREPRPLGFLDERARSRPMRCVVVAAAQPHETSWTQLRSMLLRSMFYLHGKPAPELPKVAQAQAVVSAERQLDSLSAAQPAILQSVRRDVHTFARLARLCSVTLSDPWIASSDDGSVGVDWQIAGRRLAVTYDAGGSVEFFAASHDVSESGAVDDVLTIASWLLKGTPLHSDE